MHTVPNSPNIIEAIKDPELINGELGEAQGVCLRLLYGLPLSQRQKTLAKKYADAWDGRRRVFQEAAFICGRRSGKSDRLAGNVAVYESCFGGHEKYLSPGERAWVVSIAASKKQAGVILGYIRGKLEGSRLLRSMIEDVRSEEIDLTNGISIGVYPCSFRTIRGISVCTALCDELAFWRVEGVNVDREVLSALRPGLVTFPKSKLIVFSSPYAQQGELYAYHKNRHKTKETLVWRAPSKVMNPTISDKFLKKERERDPESYRREWLAEFSDSISNFLPGNKVDDCVVSGRVGLPYQSKFAYRAALDSAFKNDCFTFAISHKDGNKVVVDRLMGWQGSKRNPVNLDMVADEISGVLKEFHTYKVTGDQFCSEPCKQALAKKSITYQEVPFSSNLKGKIYNTLKHLVNQENIELLDHPKSIREIKSLECKLTSGGNFVIGAPNLVGYHDDYATVITLTAWRCVTLGSSCTRVMLMG